MTDFPDILILYSMSKIEALERMARIDASIAKQLSQSMTINARLHARIEALEAALTNERERCIAVCESWIGTFQKVKLKHIGARQHAVNAIEDIIEVIREGTDLRAALDKDARK